MTLTPIVRRALVLVACGLLAGSANAQSARDKVQIRSVRIGFPPGPQAEGGDETVSMTGVRDSLYKPGAWTPVYVGLTNIKRYDPDPKKDGRAVVIVETPDCDDTAHTYTVALPPFDEEDGLAGQANVVAYT